MLLNYALDDARLTERLCVDVHVKHCESCRRELEDLCALIQSADRALAHPAPRDDFDALMARIHADERAARESMVRVPVRWKTVAFRAVAAAAVVTVMVFTAPLVKRTEQVMNDLRDAASPRAGMPTRDVQVPVMTEPFVERMQAVSSDEQPEIIPMKSVETTPPAFR